MGFAGRPTTVVWEREAGDYGGPGCDNGPLPYLDAGEDCHSGSDPGAFADVDVAAEGCMW